MNDMTFPEGDAARKSLLGRTWTLQNPVPHVQNSLERRGIPSHVASVMSARGVAAESLDSYLDPKIRAEMPDPSRFIDMDTGVKHVADQMIAGKNISIWSDYDCDGVTSAAIMKRFFRMIGHGEIDVLIPDRITEGYGPNANGMRELKASGVDTVLILDAGIVAFEALNAAKEVGLDVVVIDHHEAEPEIPPAVAVINANRLDESPGFGNLCAAGMAFIFCVGLARELKGRGWFDGKEGRPVSPPQQKMMELLELVGLGTVADVMILTGINRAFVARGVEYCNKGVNPGLAALRKIVLKPSDVITSKDFGWKFGPRINAAGRIDDAMLGVRLLTTDDAAEADRLAKKLDEINAKRKSIEEKVTGPAIEQFEGRFTAGIDRKIAIAVVDEAHEGVVGISAGRLKEAYDCPAIVLAQDHEGNLKGSARSVKGFSIGHAIIEARKAGLILKGGGHDMAGGLTLRRDQLEAFETFVNAEIKKSDYYRDGVSTEVDIFLSPSDLTVDLIGSFGHLEPCGNGNPSPRVVVEGAIVKEIWDMKQKHLKVVLDAGKHTIDALIWGAYKTHIHDFLEQAKGCRIDVYGSPDINEFRGERKTQIIVDDLREHAGSLL